MRGPLCATQTVHNGITYCSIRVVRKAVYSNILLGGLLWADVQSRLLGWRHHNRKLFFVFSKRKQEIVFKKKKFLFWPPQEVCTQLILITFSTIGYFYKAHKKWNQAREHLSWQEIRHSALLFNIFIQLHYRVFAFNYVCTMRTIKLDPRCTFLKCFFVDYVLTLYV